VDQPILETLSGNATPSVQERVRRWRAESSENEAYYQSVALVWAATAPGDDTANAPEVDAAATTPVDPAMIVSEAERRRTDMSDRGVISLQRERSRRGPHLTGRSALAIAAVLAAVAVSIRLLTTVLGDSLPAVSYTAANDAPRTVVLDDGSYVRLAAGSRIEAGFAGTERAVTLTGRAFFAVAHDSGRPFVVRTGRVETRVLGTRFEVARADDAARIIVLDGLVKVSNRQGEVQVPAGSVAHAAGGSPPTAERPADIRTLLDWPGGLLLFQDTPLARVAEDVASYFGRSVVIEGEALRSLRISGSFEEEGFEEVVEALSQAAGAACRFTASGAVLSPARPDD